MTKPPYQGTTVWIDGVRSDIDKLPTDNTWHHIIVDSGWYDREGKALWAAWLARERTGTSIGNET